MRRAVYERARGHCERCGRPVALHRAEATADRPYMEAAHLKPFGAGGRDDPDNVECCCKPCHDEETYG